MVTLTPMEEEKILSDYSEIAWKMVHRFSDGKGSSIFSQEDLHQECMLVLIQHMYKCETKEDLKRFHPVNLVNAMTRFVLKNQIIRLDHNRTDQSRQILNSCPQKAPLEDAATVAAKDDIDQLIEGIAFEQFLNSKMVRPFERTALLKMKDGYQFVEIAEETGKKYQVVQYAIKSARNKYAKFIA